MSATVIQGLAERLHSSDPANSHEQREIFERIRELRSAFDGPLDPESHRCLEAAGMLVAYLARMGALAGDDVRSIAVRLLRCAADAEDTASSGPAPAPMLLPASEPPQGIKMHVLPGAPPVPEPVPTEGAEIPLSATDLVGDMMLGQILLQRGQILDEHIHQAIKVQRTTSMRIGDIFVKIGACSRAQVADALSHQAQLRRVRDNICETVEKMKTPDIRGTGLKLVGEAMLGEILVERNVITRRQLERALEFQKLSGSRIGEALVKMGATTIEQIEQALRVQGRERRFTNATAAPKNDAEKK
jgi:hypothetical protein